MDQPVDLSVIIVNWNARDRLAECLASIPSGALPSPSLRTGGTGEQRAGRLSLETWVVDNGSTEARQGWWLEGARTVIALSTTGEGEEVILRP